MNTEKPSICPYCGHAMELGHLNTRSPLIWYPEGAEPPVFQRHARPGLNQHESGSLDFLLGWITEAWFCAACKIVLYQTKN